MATPRMQACSQTKANALAWASLPAEIRLMILETIATQKHPSWASFASVCREWQHVLEKINFHKVKLGVLCLDDFDRVATPQEGEVIRHIFLSVELPRYTPVVITQPFVASVRTNDIVTKGIRRLLPTLSTCEPGNDLPLEINAYSPSDCEYWFKNIHLTSDNIDHDEDAMPEAWRTGSQYHDPQYGWEHGRQV